ncbi:MAG: trimethylamine methyltransferase family protein, partial [Gammaproteobacteria bacterium]
THGEGHFLGRPETLERMQSDFVYPQIADRRSLEEWEAAGAREIREVAIERTREILGHYYPRHIPEAVDATLRERFDIHLASEDMRAK